MRRYGYVFSVKKSVFSFLIIFVSMFLLGQFFGLGPAARLALIAAGGILFPFLIRNTYKNRYLQRKFSDLNIYMEQFLYSFQKTGKVLTTLKDVYDLFEEGEMKRTLYKAIDHIEHTYTGTGISRSALGIIEEAYPYDGLSTMHGFAVQTEELGGSYYDAIMLLLESRRMWADRVYTLMRIKKKKRSDIILSIITSLLLCTMVHYFSGRMDIDVASHPVAQIITTVVLTVDLFIYYLADRKLVGGYFEENDGSMSGEEAAAAFERLWNYKDTVFGRMAARALKKRLSREIEKRFPQWLLQISLLLQTENVQVALIRSYENAPGVLKPPLLKMIGTLKLSPGDIGAYTRFLSEFTLPEVRSTMKMLHSISEGSGGDAAGQIADIVRRSTQLNDKSKQLGSEDAVAGMYALFLAPQLTGGLKLMVDMALIFVVYVGRMNA